MLFLCLGQKLLLASIIEVVDGFKAGIRFQEVVSPADIFRPLTVV